MKSIIRWNKQGKIFVDDHNKILYKQHLPQGFIKGSAAKRASQFTHVC